MCDIGKQHQELDHCPKAILNLAAKGNIQIDSRTHGRHDYNYSRKLCIEKGVTTIPVSAFYTLKNQEQNQSWIRFAFCKDDNTIEEAIRRLG